MKILMENLNQIKLINISKPSDEVEEFRSGTQKEKLRATLMLISPILFGSGIMVSFFYWFIFMRT